MKRTYWIIPVVVLTTALMTVASAFAQTGFVNVAGVNCDIIQDEDDDDAFPKVVFSASASDGLYDLEMQITSLSSGDSTSVTFRYDGDSDSVNDDWDTGLEDANATDRFRVKAELFDDDGTRISDFEGDFACGDTPIGGGYSPSVTILDLSTSQFADNEGNLACGVFDVEGWGFKIIARDVVPACAPFSTFEIKCQAGDEGLITGRDIYDVTSDAFNIEFESKTHGVCGVFASGPLQPAPAGPAITPATPVETAPIQSVGEAIWGRR